MSRGRGPKDVEKKRTRSRRSSNPVDVIFGSPRDIEVEDEADGWDIETTRCHVSCHQDLSLTWKDVRIDGAIQETGKEPQGRTRSELAE